MTREQLEQQAEQDRAAVAGTLHELNKRLTPGEIVDEVLDYMKGGGNEFLGNLGKQVTANPMPVALAGAGLAWFFIARNSGNINVGSSAHTYSGNGQSMGATASSTAQKVGETAGKIGDMATTAADGVSDSIHAMGEAVGDAASTAYQQASDGLSAAKDSAMQAEARAMAAAKSALAFCQEQPLVLAGVGLAIGAAIGAVLPHTEFEDELLGDTSDEMKAAAKDIAVDQLDKAKSLGGKIGEALKSEDAENTLTEDEAERSQSGAYGSSGADRPNTGLH